MHPAYSVIFFTVVSGAGYGLAFLLSLGLIAAGTVAAKAGWVIALIMIGAGLLSSTLHLGNPQRAWRAFSQWRSSWLSREGVMAIVTFIPLGLLALNEVILDGGTAISNWAWLGVIGAVLCVVTVYCTAMIYASLRTVTAWHTFLTPTCYVIFSFASGLLLGAALTSLFGGEGHWIHLYTVGAIALLAAAMVKFAWWGRMDNNKGISDMASATGLGHIGKVRLLERPHMTENYLTSEMGFRIARKHTKKLRHIVLGCGFVLPFLVMALLAIWSPQAGSFVPSMLLVFAVFAFFIGLFVERWLFFAEAKHAVMQYYGGDAYYDVADRVAEAAE